MHFAININVKSKLQYYSPQIALFRLLFQIILISLQLQIIIMQNQKYNPGSFSTEKQMHSSTYFEPIGNSRSSQIIPATTPGGFPTNMKSSMMSNYEGKKFENMGSLSPRASYSSNQSQQYTPVIAGNFQQGKDMNNVAKTYLKKQSVVENVDILTYVKQLQKKISKMNQTLNNHEQILNEKYQKSNTMNSSANSSATSSSDITYDSFQREIANIVQYELQKQLKKTQGSIFQEIQRVKNEVKDQKQTIKRQQFQFFLKKLQNQIYVLKRQISKDFTQLRETNISQKKNLYDILTQQFETKINRFHEASKDAFTQIEHNFLDIKQILQALKAQNLLLKLSINEVSQNNQLFTSNKKFHDPRLIKYKQIIQTSSNEYCQETIINEVNYYIDRDGFLLDKNYYYLMDKNNRYIQFKDKQLNILKNFNILH